MILKALAVGPFGCNCYIVGDDATREAVIIDPGDEAAEILRLARGLKVGKILHTHGHLDHVSGTRGVREGTGAEILIHRADQALYERLTSQYADTRKLFGISLGKGHDPVPPDGFLEDGGILTVGKLRIRVIHTPGHTPGGCCFQVGDALFSGDTLFCGSVGRTDLPGGDMEELEASIREKLYALAPATVVYPGHGPTTSIGDEKEGNTVVPA